MSAFQLLPRRVEAPKPSRFSYDVPVHSLEQIFACGVGRQFQLRVQSVKFEDVMVDWPGGRSGAEVGRWLSPSRRKSRAVTRSVRGDLRRLSLRAALLHFPVC